MGIVGLIVAFVVVAITLSLWINYRRLKREAYIRAYIFPKGLFVKLRAKHPTLSIKDCELVARGLRKFFLVYLRGNRKPVAMPSQVVDDLWHEFILYTRNYEQFNQKAFGRFLHHTPAAVMGKDRSNNEALRRTWWQACVEENINPRTPNRLPLLFALDTKFNIVEGFRYATDCSAMRKLGFVQNGTAVQCGGDFSSSSFDGSTDGFGDSSNDASSDGGAGDGGGGCGGGGD